MKLIDFLSTETKAKELCVIRIDGWTSASCWIDSEDLFEIPDRLSARNVKNDEWGYLSIIDQYAQESKIPCHFIDI